MNLLRDHIKDVSNCHTHDLCPNDSNTNNQHYTAIGKIEDACEKIGQHYKEVSLSTSIINYRHLCTTKAVSNYVNKKVKECFQKVDYLMAVQQSDEHTKGSHYKVKNNSNNDSNGNINGDHHDNVHNDGDDDDDHDDHDHDDNDHGDDDHDDDDRGDDDDDDRGDDDDDDRSDDDDDDRGDDDDDDHGDDDHDDDDHGDDDHDDDDHGDDDHDDDDHGDDDGGGGGGDDGDPPNSNSNEDDQGGSHLFCFILSLILLLFVAMICLLGCCYYKFYHLKCSDSKFVSPESQHASSVIPWGMSSEACPSGLMPATNALQCSAFEYCFNQYSTIKCGRAPKFKIANESVQDYNFEFCLSDTCITITEEPVKVQLAKHPLLRKHPDDFAPKLVHIITRKMLQCEIYSIKGINKFKANGLVQDNAALCFSHGINFLRSILILISHATVKDDMTMLNHLMIKSQWKHTVKLSSPISNANMLKKIIQLPPVCTLHGFQACASVKLKSWDAHVESRKDDCYIFKNCLISTNPTHSCITSRLTLVDINFQVKDLQYLVTEMSQLAHSWNLHGLVFPHYCDPPSFPSSLIVMNDDKLCNNTSDDTKGTVLLDACHIFIKILDFVNLVFLPLPMDIFMSEISVPFHYRLVFNNKKCWSFPHYSDPPLHMKILKNQMDQSKIHTFKTACNSKQLFCLRISQKLSWVYLQQEVYIMKCNNLIKLKHFPNCFSMSNSIRAVFSFTRCDDGIDIMCFIPSKSFYKYANPEISKEQLLLIITLLGDWKLSLHILLERYATMRSNKIPPQHIPSNTLLAINCDFSVVTNHIPLTNQCHFKEVCSKVQIKHCYHPPWYCSYIFIDMKLSNMKNKNFASVEIYGFIWQQSTNGNDNNHCFRHKSINKNLLIDKGKSVMVLQSNIRLNHKSFSITVDNVHLKTQIVISTRYTNTPAIDKLWSLRAASVMDNYKQHGTDCQLIFPHYDDPPSAEKRPRWSTITSKNIMLTFRWTEKMYYKITFKSWNTEKKIYNSNALNFPHYSDPPHHSSSWSLGTFHIMTTLYHCHVVSNFKGYTDHCKGTAYQGITNWKALQKSKMKLDHGRSDRGEHLTIINASIHYFWCSIIWTLINQVCTGHQTHHNVSLLINFPCYCDPPIYLQNFWTRFFEYRYDYGLTANTNLQKFDGTYNTICKDGTARNENLNVIRYNFFRPLHDREENDTKLSSVELDCYVNKWNCVKNCTQILMLLNSIADYLSSSMFGCNEFDSISEILKFSTSLSTEKQYYCGKDLLCRMTYPWKNKHWTSILNSFTTMTKTEFNIVARRINRNFITLCVENQITNHSNGYNITDTFSLLQSITTHQWQQEVWIWLVTKSSVAQNVIDFLIGSYYVVIFGAILMCFGISALQVFTARIQGKISIVKLSLMHIGYSVLLEHCKHLRSENQPPLRSNPLPLLQGIDDFTSNERGILDFVHQYQPNENSTPTPHQPTVNFPSGNVQVRYK